MAALSILTELVIEDPQKAKAFINALEMSSQDSVYSQCELAEKSGVSLRSIQQYEQRVKDINKISISNLQAIAKTLGYQAEDIVEYEIRDAEE